MDCPVFNTGLRRLDYRPNQQCAMSNATGHCRWAQVVMSKVLLAEVHIVVHVVLAGYQCVARIA